MAKIKHDIDNGALRKAERDYQADKKKSNDLLAKEVGLSRKADAATRRFLQSGQSARDRYNRRVAESVLLVRRGAITQEEATQVLARHRQKLDEVGASQRRSFGPQALGAVGSLIRGYASAGSAIALVTRELIKFKEERDQAAEGSRQAVRGEGSLAQLAVTQGDTQAEREAALQRLRAESRRQFGRGAATTRDEAAGDLFSLVSAELSRRDRNLAFDVKRAGVFQNIGEAASSFKALRTALGADEVGSFDDFLDQALKASSLAPAQANEIPLATTRAGGSARALGLSDEFLFAATALAAGKTGSASEGGTQIAAFLKQIEKATPNNRELLEGRSGLEIVRALASLPESEQGFGGILGDRAEAIAGFRVLRDNLEQLEQQVAGQAAAQRENLAQQSVAISLSDPNTLAAVLERQAKNQLELDNLDSATNDLLTNAAIKEARRTRNRRAAEGDALDQAVAGVNNFSDPIFLNLETLFGLFDRAGYKREGQQNLLDAGLIENRELRAAIEENTAAIRESNTPGTRQE